LDKPTSAQPGHFHAVRFYENQDSLARIVAEFLGEGFALGQPALVIATPEHRDGIVRELRAQHFDLDRMQAAGALLILDARDMLAEFMVDGMPDVDRFRTVAVAAIERVARGQADCVRAYGEMVDLLWKDEQTVAAVRLEMLWNQLATTHDFKLLCGYAMGSFYKDVGMAEICGQHTHVVADDGSVTPAKPGPTVN
jgi:hypothetical protein